MVRRKRFSEKAQERRDTEESKVLLRYGEDHSRFNGIPQAAQSR
jgi:hypothetical protein